MCGRLCRLVILVCTLAMWCPLGSPGPAVYARRPRRGSQQPKRVTASVEPIDTCQSQTNQSLLNSFLWVMKREPPSFLFGTIHVPHSRVWSHIPENTKEAFYRADRVYFELDLTDPYTISSLASCQLLPHGETLNDVIPTDLYRRLRLHLDVVRRLMPTWVTADQRKAGLFADYLFDAITANWERKRPVWVMLMVNSLTKHDIQSRGTPVLDLYLAQEAQRLGKRTGAVEQVDEQCLPLNRLNFSQVLFALNQTLQHHERSLGRPPLTATQHADDLIKHYNCGDLDSVLFSQDTTQVPNLLNSTSLSPDNISTAKLIDDYFREELIHKRNQRMADRIHDILEDNPNISFFFAFGAGHFLGNNTVLDCLADRGYEVNHTAAGKLMDFGERHRRRRKKFPTLMADLEAVDAPSPTGSLDSAYFDTGRGRTRHGHGCTDTSPTSGPLGRRRSRTRCPDPVRPTAKDQSKRPQFNDLWVRLTASSSFGPENAPAANPGLSSSPVYAMYNRATILQSSNVRALLLLCTWTVSGLGVRI